MHRLPAGFAVFVCLAGAAVPKEEYRARRGELRKRVADGVVVLFARTEKEMDDARTGFRQEPNFFYLTGWQEPGAALVLAPGEELFFLPARDEKVERYTGRKTAPGDPDAPATTGFEQVLPVEQLESRILKLLESSPTLYALNREAPRLKNLAPLRELRDVQPALSALRMKKSPAELERIRESVRITEQAHLAAWKRLSPGLFEYQVAATLTAVALEGGCERNAYPPIVGSGPNATVLHYEKNTRRIESGDLVLMDSGAECAGYAADITRTVPANGKFIPRQRELYEIVLGAQEAVLRAIKPGITPGSVNTSPNSLYKIAYDYINTHGKDRHGKPLGKYLTHGVSHHVGLQVHDPGAPDKALEAGMVVTVEPGLYIPEENVGIRIEDMVLVTDTGAKLLSTGLPKNVHGIEKAMESSPPRNSNSATGAALNPPPAAGVAASPGLSGGAR